MRLDAILSVLLTLTSVDAGFYSFNNIHLPGILPFLSHKIKLRPLVDPSTCEPPNNT